MSTQPDRKRIYYWLEPLDLIDWDALILQHHWNAVIYPIDVLSVPGDQSFRKRSFNRTLVGVADFAGCDRIIDQGEVRLSERKDWLLGHWAAKDIQ